MNQNQNTYPKTIIIMLKSSYGGIFAKEFTFNSYYHERAVRSKLIGRLA